MSRRGALTAHQGPQGLPFELWREALVVAPSSGTIVLRGGAYNEQVAVYKTVTIQNYPGEEVWLDGSTAVKGWVKDGTRWRHDGWTTRFDHSPTYTKGAPDLTIKDWQFVNTTTAPMAAHPDQLWINGGRQKQAASLSALTGRQLLPGRVELPALRRIRPDRQVGDSQQPRPGDEHPRIRRRRARHRVPPVRSVGLAYRRRHPGEARRHLGERAHLGDGDDRAQHPGQWRPAPQGHGQLLGHAGHPWPLRRRPGAGPGAGTSEQHRVLQHRSGLGRREARREPRRHGDRQQLLRQLRPGLLGGPVGLQHRHPRLQLQPQLR